MSDDILRLKCDVSGALAFLDEVEVNVIKAAEKGLAVAVLDLMGEGARRAPILTGNLRGSGSCYINGHPVGHTENEAGSTSIVEDGYTPTGMSSELLGEVGFDTEYATNQHETLTYAHPRGGEAKYLENPMKEKSDRYEAIIGESVRGVL